MKPILLSGAIALFLLTSCIKTDLVRLSQDYEHGRLLIEFKDSVSMQSAVNTCFELNTPIIKMLGFDYTSALPNDSLELIRTVLASKPYVVQSTINSSVIAGVSNKIFISGLVFHDVDEADMQDLLRLQENQGWVEYPYVGNSYPYCKSILVQVPLDSESKYAFSFYVVKGVKTIRLYNERMH
jgi:hypothetical protein